jgi:hypothetical protein
MAEPFAAFYPALDVDFVSCLIMPSCFYGPDTFLDDPMLYHTDSKLAWRPVWLFVHWIGNLGIAFIGGFSVFETGVAYFMDANITLEFRDYPNTPLIPQILVSLKYSLYSESIQSK